MNNNKNPPISKYKVAWAYTKEIMLVACLQTFAQLLWGMHPVLDFIARTAKDWAQLAGVLLAAALVIWGMYVNFITSGFGDYLRSTGREVTYRNAFSTAILAPTLAVVLLIIASGVPVGIVHQFAMAMMLYTLANIYTMYRNIVNLSAHKRKFDELMAQEDMH